MKEIINNMGNEIKNRIFNESQLIEIVTATLKKYNIEHTEVWQNPNMVESIRIYNGEEDHVMNFFFTPVKDGKRGKTRYIFREITNEK